MFGLFKNEQKSIDKLRIEFEDIRQRFIFKMNPYQQYSFISAHKHMSDKIEETLASISESDTNRWLELGKAMKRFAQKGWDNASRMGGVAGEGAIAGAEGCAFLATQCLAKGYLTPEAALLRSDMLAFLEKVDEIVTARHSR